MKGPNKMAQPSGTPDRPFPRSRISGVVIGLIALAQIVFILYMLRYVSSEYTNCDNRGLIATIVQIKPRALTTAFFEHILRTTLPRPGPSRHAPREVHSVSGERNAPLVHLSRP